MHIVARPSQEWPQVLDKLPLLRHLLLLPLGWRRDDGTWGHVRHALEHMPGLHTLTLW